MQLKPIFRLWPLLGASLALMGAQSSWAVASSSVTLSDLTITLIDLNPMDANAPSIVFNNNSSNYYGSFASGYAYSYDGAGTYLVNYNDTQYGDTSKPFSNVSVAGGGSASSVAASVVAGTSDLGPHTLSASGQTLGAPVSGGSSQYSATATAPNYYGYGNFTLSPDTIAIFSATANLSASTTVGYDATNGQVESAYASYSMNVSGSNGVNSQSSSSSDGVSASYSYVWDGTQYVYSPQSASSTDKASVTFVNTSSGSTTGNFYVQVAASGSSGAVIATVPESGSLAMCLAGLGVLGALRARRKDKVQG